jgi:phosphatidate cytidylyltransferase
MLARRLVSAAVGIPLLILTVFVGGRVYDVVLAVVLAAATAEFLYQAGVELRDPLLWLAAVAAAALPLAASEQGEPALLVLSIFLMLSLLGALKSYSSGKFERWSLSVAIAIYVGWLGSYFGLLRQAQGGRDWVLFLLLVTFASDTGAYAVGRLVGRHKLAPRISPGKTIEGAAGGLTAAALIAVLAGRLLALPGAPARLFALGLVLSVAAQLGDLAESALKRRLEIKDAGRLLPGHGGLLDRLDSLLFAGAVLYYAVRWMSL